MAQSLTTNPLLDNLDEEINAAETTFDLSALTTQVLLGLATQLTRSADKLSEVVRNTDELNKHQGEIAKKASESADDQREIAKKSGEVAWDLGEIAWKTRESATYLDEISKRGDHDCPVHVIIGERPLQVAVDLHQGACDAIRVLLTEVCGSFPPWTEFRDLMAKCEALETRCRDLQTKYQGLETSLRDLDHHFRHHHHTALRNSPVFPERG